MRFFKENPVACWMWHWDFMKLLDSGIKPNEGHFAIEEYLQFCENNQDQKCLLVT